MRFRNSGLNKAIKTLIKKEIYALDPNTYMTEHSFSTSYNIDVNRIVPLFLELEEEGFFRSNDIDIGYITKRYSHQNIKIKIYIKKGDTNE